MNEKKDLFNFDILKKEIGEYEKIEKKEYYRRKIINIENEYTEENRKIMKWLEKIKIEMNKDKYSKKEKAYIHFQLNMFYQERSDFRKKCKEIQFYFENFDKSKDLFNIKLLYEKIEKSVKKIKRYKENIEEYIEEKCLYKDISEVSKIMIENFDIKNPNKSIEDNSDSSKI